MQLLLGYFLFMVLLRRVATFQCVNCQKEGASNCTASLQACNSGENTCLRSLTEIVEGGKTQTNVILSCAPLANCKTQFIELSHGKGLYVRRQYDCCQTDGCAPPSTKMLPLNTTLNRKHCPVCSLEKGRCLPDDRLECTGSATYCFAAFTKDGMRKPVKGCTTNSICDILKLYQGPLIGDSAIQIVTCEEAESVRSSSSLEVSLLALLPMNLFLLSAY